MPFIHSQVCGCTSVHTGIRMIIKVPLINTSKKMGTKMKYACLTQSPNSHLALLSMVEQHLCSNDAPFLRFQPLHVTMVHHKRA